MTMGLVQFLLSAFPTVSQLIEFLTEPSVLLLFALGISLVGRLVPPEGGWFRPIMAAMNIGTLLIAKQGFVVDVPEISVEIVEQRNDVPNGSRRRGTQFLRNFTELTQISSDTSKL